MKKAHMARQKLLRLGIFKEVEVLIDTSEGTAGPSPPPSALGDRLVLGLDGTDHVTVRNDFMMFLIARYWF